MKLVFSQQESQALTAARTEWDRRHPGTPFPLNAEAESRLVAEAEDLLRAALSAQQESSNASKPRWPTGSYRMQLPQPPAVATFDPVDFQKAAEDERHQQHLEWAAYRVWLNTKASL